MNRRELLCATPLLGPQGSSTAGVGPFALKRPLERCRVRGRVLCARHDVRLVLYAKTDFHYIQPCLTGPKHLLRDDGRFGPIDTHNGRLFILAVHTAYQPSPFVAQLPIADGKDILALAGPFSTAVGCDVARCPAL